MLASRSRALTSRAAGPLAGAVALASMILLAVGWANAARDAAQLRDQVGRAALAARDSDGVWRAKLVSCQAQAEALKAAAEPAADLRLTPVAGTGDAVADKLATEGPAGFDVCARMEAADRAVLASLKAR
jgi:predicted flap endonuclease-1-like 5' DNA nuclease